MSLPCNAATGVTQRSSVASPIRTRQSPVRVIDCTTNSAAEARPLHLSCRACPAMRFATGQEWPLRMNLIVVSRQQHDRGASPNAWRQARGRDRLQGIEPSRRRGLCRVMPRLIAQLISLGLPAVAGYAQAGRVRPFRRRPAGSLEPTVSRRPTPRREAPGPALARSQAEFRRRESPSRIRGP